MDYTNNGQRGRQTDQHAWNNQVAGNLNYLKATVASKVHTAGADITSTSTSFVDVDATNIANSIITVGDDAFC
jgi:hypothetical protein